MFWKNFPNVPTGNMKPGYLYLVKDIVKNIDIVECIQFTPNGSVEVRDIQNVIGCNPLYNSWLLNVSSNRFVYEMGPKEDFPQFFI